MASCPKIVILPGPDGTGRLLRGLLSNPRCIGLDVTIFDPDLDPEGAHAKLIVSLLRDAVTTA